MNIIEEIKKNNYLNNIIYVNISVFIIINIFIVILFLLQKNIEIISIFGASSNIEVLVRKPWTIITYMFVHEDFFHVFMNMLWLYFSGKIFTQYLSQKQLLSTYLMGGFIGAIIYILAFNIFPVFDSIKYDSVAIGASASVFAILIATATHIPNFMVNIFFVGHVKLKHIAIIAIIIDILSIPKGNSGGHIAHLGGALYGYLYIYLANKKINTNYVADLLISLVFDKNQINLKKRTENDYDYNARKRKEESRLNKILDKINKSGYNSLSDEEKEELFKQN